jgi:hypothetical protein
VLLFERVLFSPVYICDVTQLKPDGPEGHPHISGERTYDVVAQHPHSLFTYTAEDPGHFGLDRFSNRDSWDLHCNLFTDLAAALKSGGGNYNANAPVGTDYQSEDEFQPANSMWAPNRWSYFNHWIQKSRLLPAWLSEIYGQDN